MREKFPGYFANTNERRDRLWSECIFVFDTNVLTSVYKRSDEAKEALYRILGSVQDRIWIPHQVAAEFLDNRAKISHDQSKLYSEAITSLNKVLADFEVNNKHPFLKKHLHDKFVNVSKDVLVDLELKRDFHDKRSTNDDVMPAIADFFAGKVGDEYSRPQLVELLKKGEERYANTIPPGYKDIDKYKSSNIFSEQCKKFGDLIFWQQILDHATAVKKSVILVTEEQKEDWWQKSGGKTIGPLPQLIEEFNQVVGKDFYLYSSYNFLDLANGYLHQNTSKEVIAEVKEASKESILDSMASSLNKRWPNNDQALIDFSRSYFDKTYADRITDSREIEAKIEKTLMMIRSLDSAINTTELALKEGVLPPHLIAQSESQMGLNRVRRSDLSMGLKKLEIQLARLRFDINLSGDDFSHG